MAILLDTNVGFDKYEAWRVEDAAFWKAHINVEPTYTLIRQDYSSYPTYVDSDGDIRPTHAYLKSLSDTIVATHGEFAFDFIMVMVHEDNWLSDPLGDKGKGIWGTNYSYVFGKQCLEYCRWDRDNQANTFGVAYHERHHSFDAIIKQETGVIIEPLLNVDHGKYDHCITHGNCRPWKYIRWKENIVSLEIMAPYLRRAFLVRKERHEQHIEGLMATIIDLLQQKLYLLRMLRNRKDGIIKIT